MNNSQRKSVLALARAKLPHLALVMHSIDEQVTIIDTRTLRQKKTASDAELEVLLKHSHKWRVFTSVFLEVNGDSVIKTDDHEVSDSYKQEELVEYLKSHHKEQLEKERAGHVTGFGWVALPVSRDLTVEQINSLYEKVSN